MPRPTDASPSPFVGYYSPDTPLVDVPTDAPGSQNSQVPFVHPQDLASPFATDEYDISQERGIAVSRLAEQAVRKSQLVSPHWHVLHDRLRTTQAWKNGVDALYEGSPATPAAGAFSATPLFPDDQPMFPGNPGTLLLHPFVNFCAVGAQGTTLTGLWTLDLVFPESRIPLGVFSGLGAQIVRPELIAPVPMHGDHDRASPYATLILSILSGATVSAVVFYVQLSLSFSYRFVDTLSDVRQHGLHESEWGEG